MKMITLPLWAICSCNDQVLAEETNHDQLLEYVDISSVSQERGIERTESFRFADAPSRARRIVQEGDVLVSTVRTYLKAIAKVDALHSHCIASTGFAVLRSKNNFVDKEFLAWLLKSNDVLNSIIINSKGISYPAITSSDLMDIRVKIPINLGEQKLISDFLKRKMERLEAIISKLQNTLTQLSSYRQFLINQAVTQGIDTDTKFLQVPLWFICTCNDEVLPETTPHDTLINYVDISSVSQENGIERSEQLSFEQAPSRARRVIKKGDILVSTVRTYLRAIAHVGERYENCVASTGFAVLRAKENCNKKFLSWLMRSDDVINKILIESKGVSYPAIISSDLMNIRVFIPEHLIDQEKISVYLEMKISKVEKTIELIRKNITQLESYRDSLISAAVTGQLAIDEEANAQVFETGN